MDQADMNCEESNIHVTQTVKAASLEARSLNNTDYSKHRGVRHTKSGKWGAVIRHPITKVSVWLGSYHTPKAAADAYTKKKLEFDSMFTDAAIEKNKAALARTNCKAKVMDEAEINCKKSNVHAVEAVKALSVEAGSLNNTDDANCPRRLPGTGSVYQNKPGRWRAVISIRKTKVDLGTYTTREQAETALHKRKQDLDPTIHYDEAVAKELDSGCSSKSTRKPKKASREPMDLQLTCSRPRGVYSRVSGKWFAEIKNPMTKVRHSVGTYVTAQEALDAFNRKKREYAEMKCKQSTAETQLISKSEDNISYECGGSRVNLDSLQLPCSSFVSDGECDNSSSVINAYGELVGEFSALDDDLWFC